MNNSLGSIIPKPLPGWTYVKHDSFSSTYNANLPPQENGSDCGMFVIMYFWYISHDAKFDFKTNDMPQIRKWFYSLLMNGTFYEEVSPYILWLTSKLQGNKIGSLNLQIPMEENVQRGEPSKERIVSGAEYEESIECVVRKLHVGESEQNINSLVMTLEGINDTIRCLDSNRGKFKKHPIAPRFHILTPVEQMEIISTMNGPLNVFSPASDEYAEQQDLFNFIVFSKDALFCFCSLCPKSNVELFVD